MAQPALQKPGAGLPFFEGLVAKYIYYPNAMRHFSWEESLRQMAAETDRIIALVQSLDENAFHTPVLIERLTGLEDSSRNWSAAMTIEHLLITMRGMAHIVTELSAGRPFENKTGTADVKPAAGGLPPRDQMIAALRQQSAAHVAKLMPFGATASARYKSRHPFFGPIPAKGWVCVLGIHQKLHRVQTGRIINGLANP